MRWTQSQSLWPCQGLSETKYQYIFVVIDKILFYDNILEIFTVELKDDFDFNPALELNKYLIRFGQETLLNLGCFAVRVGWKTFIKNFSNLNKLTLQKSR